jgi:hypothetical protein
MVFCIIRTEDGLVTYSNTYPGGPAAYFADVAQETYVVKNAIYILQTLVGDAVAVGSIFLSTSLKLLYKFLSGNRSIVVTSFGKLPGSSFYHACYGAASQVGLQ